ncbi:MAG: SDR family oxidoreductase [Flavobacteriales bacterium]|tara:strand:- start:38 stop:748 length:711 start_codon:yes stop_codon:yes gene_type:complete
MTNSNKHIVITGASSGIGYSTALSLAKQGHTIYALARNKDKLCKLVEDSKNLSGTIKAVPFDLSLFNNKSLEDLFKEVPLVDILINNAGLLLNKNFLEIEEQEILEVLQVNYISVIKSIQFFHSRLKKSKIPHIVNISSVGGVTGSVKFPGLSIYSSSKGALSILSECLAKDFEEDHIAVNCLALGAVNTEMLNKAFPDYEAQISPFQMGEYVSNFALNGHKVINGVTQVVSLSNP